MTEQPAPTGSRMERKKEETRRKIVRAAVDLFNRQGLDATTMEQIAAAADIAKGTLYHYFPLKEAIIVAFMQQTFEERSPRRTNLLHTLPDTRARMRLIFGELVAGVQAQKDIFETYMLYRVRSMLSFQPDEGMSSGLHQLGQQIIALGQQGGEIRIDWPAMVVEDLFEFAVVEVIKQFYLDPESFVAPTAIDQAVELFLSAVRPASTEAINS
jgi:AcrR family transcriptional regulator